MSIGQVYGRARFLGIKEILDRGCESETNRFPTNDGVRNFDFLFLIVNLLLTIFTPVILCTHSYRSRYLFFVAGN